MYSNCLFEALKAKIRNWNTVQIHLIPLTLNHFNLHFYWVDILDNRVVHYTSNATGIWSKLNIILFKGKKKSTPIVLFEERLYKKMSIANWSLEKQLKTAKKLGFQNTKPFKIDRD